MLVVMHSHATPAQVAQVLDAIRQMNLTPHPMPGATRTAIGITGNVNAVDPRTLEVLPGVFELIRVTKPYKLASREMHAEDTFVRIPLTPRPPLPQRGEGESAASPSPLVGEGGRGGEGITIGPGTFTLIAGPCSV